MLRRTVAAAAAALALVLGAGACSASDSDSGSPSVTAGPTASAAPDVGSSLSPAEFAAAAQLPGAVIVDVRTPQEYAEGHLEGAVLMNLEDPEGFADQVGRLDPAGTYAIYCRSGNRSAAAMDYFAQRGFESYFDLAGGIGTWTEGGGAVVTD